MCVCGGVGVRARNANEVATMIHIENQSVSHDDNKCAPDIALNSTDYCLLFGDINV